MENRSLAAWSPGLLRLLSYTPEWGGATLDRLGLSNESLAKIIVCQQTNIKEKVLQMRVPLFKSL